LRRNIAELFLAHRPFSIVRLLRMLLQSAVMEEEVDVNKVVRGHLKMDEFFTGFVAKGKAKA
jgi:hypothetical protein